MKECVECFKIKQVHFHFYRLFIFPACVRANIHRVSFFFGGGGGSFSGIEWNVVFCRYSSSC